MEKKKTQRQLRHEARLARERRQRLRIGAIVLAVVIILGVTIGANVIRTNQENANATATTLAQFATNTAIALTPQPTPESPANAQATITALGASVGPMSFAEPPEDLEKTASGLQYKDIVLGTGGEAKAGDNIYVHYTGWLTDGTEFDSSVGGQPYNFPLGAGRVIRGWDEGVAGMKVGGRRLLVIPPDLGYGSQDKGTIPPNSTLIFEVVLLGIAQ